MPPTLTRIERPCGIKQQVSAGGNFDGSAPAGDPTLADDLFVFAAESDGGLFDPTSSKYAFEHRTALCLVAIELKLANQSAWSVTKLDKDGLEVTVLSGTTEANVVRGMHSTQLPLILLWGEKLKVSTTGATTGPMAATLKFAPYPIFT
jgi:hypothetical protein